MAEATSALKDHRTVGPLGRNSLAGIILSEVTRFSLIQVATWPDSLASAAASAASAAGCGAAPGPGLSAIGSTGTVLRIEPLKWWLLSHDAAPRFDLPAESGAILDLSSARSWFRLSGSKTTTLLNHFLPLDLRDACFADGAVASTAFHHVGVTLWRAGEEWNLFLPRSFSVTLYELLIQSAAQYELKIIEPT